MNETSRFEGFVSVANNRGATPGEALIFAALMTVANAINMLGDSGALHYTEDTTVGTEFLG